MEINNSRGSTARTTLNGKEKIPLPLIPSHQGRGNLIKEHSY
jgi:hypothetical protein